MALLDDRRFDYKYMRFEVNRSSISNADEIKSIADDANLPSLPEMLFGRNYLRLIHVPSGCGLEFNTRNALKMVDRTACDLQVSPAKEWKSSRPESGSVPVFRPFDWTFTTTYKGDLLPGNGFTLVVQPTEEDLNFKKLLSKEHIVLYREIDLFEDELGDNGISKLTVKLRVMKDCFLLLQRFFLKVDGVILRSYETRVYHDMESCYFIRTFTKKERRTTEIINNALDPSSLFDQSHILSKTNEKLIISMT